MSVVVAHPSLNRGGGAEKVCLTLIKSLYRGGYKVRLATIDKTDWGFLEGRFGKLYKPIKETYFMEAMPVTGRTSQAAFSLWFLPLLLYLRMRRENDLLVNTYGDLIDSIADVSYVNALPVRISHLYPQSQFSDSIIWRWIAQFYGLALKPIDRIAGYGMLLANSRFTQSFVSKSLKRRSLVVYPPVDLTNIRQAPKDKNRDDMVVTVSRIRFGKHLETVPRVAKRVKNARFTIIGLADPGSQNAIRVLEKTIKELGVEDRVKVLVNQPFQKLAKILSSSKALLNTQPTEAFGMSVVEAMFAGCVPIVPRNGGPWYDILESVEGKYGFSYNHVDEAAQKIKVLIDNESLRKEVSERAVKRASVFDSSIFEDKILKLVNKVFSSKHH